jgi:PAS domain S-box-containing protein
MTKTNSAPLKLRNWITSLALLILIFVAAGYRYYISVRDNLRTAAHHNLRTVSDLKSRDISGWLHERVYDLHSITTNPLSSSAVARWCKNPSDPELTREVRRWLELEKQHCEYSDLFLIDLHDSLLVSTGPSSFIPDQSTRRAIETALREKQSVMGDLYPGESSVAMLDVVSPLLNEAGEPFLILIGQNNAAEMLFPIVDMWPIPDETGEIFLVRQDGDSVVYLSELRHRPNSSLRYKVSNSLTDLPAVQAVKGAVGLVVGIDYRGIRVISNIQPIANTTWLMVAKQDEDEILTKLRYRARVITLVLTLSIAVLIFLISNYYRQRQVGIYRDLLTAERAKVEAEEEFRATLYCIGDALLSVDADGRIRRMNNIAENLTGWNEAEVRGQPLSQVFKIQNELTGETMVSPVQRVLQEGRVVGLANHTVLISRDGSKRAIADSAAPIFDASGKITGVVMVFRDQSEERRASIALMESEKRFRTIFEQSPISLWEEDFSVVKQRLEELKTRGVSDLNSYFISHPEFVVECAGLVKITRINEATVKLYGATSKEELLAGLGVVFTEDSFHQFANELIALSEKKLSMTTKVVNKTLAGDRIDLLLQWTVAPGFENDYSRVLVSIIDITELKHASDELQYRLKLEQLVSRISFEFVNTSIDLIDDSIISSLGLLAQFAGVGRSSIYMVDVDESRLVNCHNWKDPALGEDAELPEAIPFDKVGWIKSRLLLCEPLIISSIDDFPPEAVSERRWNEENGFRSLLLIPLFLNDRLFGTLGLYGPINLPVPWQKTFVETMMVVGDLLLNLIKRRDAALAHRKSEEQYRLVTENAAEGILIAQDAIVKFVNPTLLQFLGYSSDEVLFHSLLDLIYPDDREMINERHNRRMLGEDIPTRYRYRLLTKARQPLWIEMGVVTIKWEERPAALAFITDITERMCAENAIRHREEILKAVSFAANEFLVNPEWEKSIDQVLAYLGQAVEVSRTYIFENHTDPDGTVRTSQRFEWVASGIEPQIDNPEMIDFPYGEAGLGRWIEILERGEVVLGHVQEFPESEQQVLSPQDIRSIVVVPVFAGGQWWGNIGFDACFEERDWAESEIKALRTAADTLGAAIQRKKTRDELQRSEEKYRTIIETATEGILIADTGHFTIDVNQKMAMLLGYTRDEMIGRHFHEFLFEEDIADSLDRFDHRKTGARDSYERRFRRKDGTEIWTLASAAPRLSQDGEFLGSFGMFTDITERKAADIAIRESEKQYKELIEFLPNGIIVHRGGKIMMINETGRKYFGATSEEELIGTPLLDRVHPEFRDLVTARIGKAQAGGTTAELIQEKLLKLNGDVFYAEVTGLPITFAGGQAMLVVFTDITERLEAEKQIHVLGRLVEEAPTSISVHDLEGNFIYANRKITELHGYTLEEFLSKNLRDLDTPETAALIKPRIKQLLTEQDASFNVDHFHKDGRILNFLIDAKIADWQGKKAILSFATDMTDRLAAERMLRESERRLSDMLTNIHLFAVNLDLEGNITFMNDYALKLTGWQFEEVYGKNWFDLFVHSNPEVYERFKRKIADDTISLHYENPISTRDGNLRLISWNNTILRDPTGKVIGTASIGQDITESRAAELKLLASEERNRLLLQNASDAIYVYEINQDGVVGPFIEVSEAASHMLGYTREEFLRMSVVDILPQDLRERRKDVFGRLLAEGSVFIEFEHLAKDGRRVPIEVSARIVKWAGKSVVLSVVRDVTERRKAEEEIRHSEAKFQDLYENAPDMYFSIDPETATLINCNHAAVTISGYSKDELIGMSLFDLVHPDVLEAARKAYLDFGNAGEVRNVEVAIRRKDGSRVDVSVNATGIRDASGRILYSRSIWRDITAIKKAEIERENLRLQLLQAQKLEAVGRLAGGVAHDFNNMLAAILGNAEMVLYKLTPEEPSYWTVQEIINAAQRSASLTRQLLAFARKQTINPKVIDLNDIVDGMQKMLTRLIGEDIELRWISASQLWKVKIDPVQIDQIVANLVLNARDAIKGHGTISIRTRNHSITEAISYGEERLLPGEYVALEVQDTGMGMNAEVLSRIFEPFFTTKEVGKGTGLGLSTVFGIVHQNLGGIAVKSQVGEGSTFTVFLPRCSEEETPQSRVFISEPLPVGEETILFVEDEAAILNMGKSVLEKLGYKVLTAISPEAALELFEAQSQSIDLLISDVVMPGMNGPELLRRFRQKRPNLRCVFISGYSADVPELEEIVKEGGNFIQKPFLLKAFAQKVREALNSSKS